MAELIDREAFLKRFTSEYRCKFTFGEAKILNVMFEELKKEPTTTEAEIRAKAIDEFAEKCNEEKWNYMNDEDEWQLGVLHGLTVAMRVAEQLKEE